MALIKLDPSDSLTHAWLALPEEVGWPVEEDLAQPGELRVPVNSCAGLRYRARAKEVVE
jgi:hypothetical protein